jgi:hypothetical protein
MIYLLTDTANQTTYLTLNEGRSYYTTAFTDYLLVLTYEMTGETLAQVVSITSENERITTIELTTETLVNAGRYRYEVYGQNSNTNTNPTDASVVGLVEKGIIELTKSVNYYDISNPTIPVDYIYTGTNE